MERYLIYKEDDYKRFYRFVDDKLVYIKLFHHSQLLEESSNTHHYKPSIHYYLAIKEWREITAQEFILEQLR